MELKPTTFSHIMFLVTRKLQKLVALHILTIKCTHYQSQKFKWFSSWLELLTFYYCTGGIFKCPKTYLKEVFLTWEHMHFFPEIPQNRIYSYSVLFSFSNRSRAFFLEMPHFLCSFFLKRTENEYVRVFKFLWKGERLFGWDTRNLFKVTQESHLFYMINYITGFFYDISPIDQMPYWGQWDLQASFQVEHFSTFWLGNET